jgi:hypothetical protein
MKLRPKFRIGLILLLCPLIGGWNGSFFGQQMVSGAANVPATVTVFSSNSSNNAAGATTVSGSVTFAGCANSLLLVTVGIMGSVNPTGVSLGATNLTQELAPLGTNGKISIYSLKNPATGTSSLNANLSATAKAVLGWTIFCNVDQTTPLGSVVQNTGTVSGVSQSATGWTGGMIHQSFVQFQTTSAASVASGQTLAWSTLSSAGGAATNLIGSGSYISATGGSQALNWAAGSGTTEWHAIAYPVNPAP